MINTTASVTLKTEKLNGSKTHVQLLFENFNGRYMEEGNEVVNHVNNMALLLK